jgi:hypothetical protein
VPFNLRPNSFFALNWKRHWIISSLSRLSDYLMGFMMPIMIR